MCQVTRRNKNSHLQEVCFWHFLPMKWLMNLRLLFQCWWINSAAGIPLAFNMICVAVLLWGSKISRKVPGTKWHTLISALPAAQFHGCALPCLLLTGLLSSTGLVCSFARRKMSSCVPHIMKSWFISPLTPPHSGVSIPALPAFIWFSPITPAAFRMAQEES